MQPKQGQDHRLRIAIPGILSCLITAGTGCASSGERHLDVEAIRAADRAYATAWLTNDPEQVMATLTEEPVLMPSGVPALEGAEAAREFWWPADSPPTTVTEFTLIQEEAGGSGDFGFVRGSFTLGFEYDGETYRSRGEYLSVLRRVAGFWRVSHRAWNDLSRTP